MLLVSRELKVGVIKLIHAHESKKADRESQVKRCRRESLAKVAIVALFMFLDPLYIIYWCMFSMFRRYPSITAKAPQRCIVQTSLRGSNGCIRESLAKGFAKMFSQ